MQATGSENLLDYPTVPIDIVNNKSIPGLFFVSDTAPVSLHEPGLSVLFVQTAPYIWKMYHTVVFVAKPHLSSLLHEL